MIKANAVLLLPLLLHLFEKAAGLQRGWGRFEHCSMSSLSAPSGVSLTVEPQSGLGLNLGPEEAVGLALWVGRREGSGGRGGFLARREGVLAWH